MSQSKALRTFPHDFRSCHLCEVPHDDAYRRHWKVERRAGHWHVIADGPHLMGWLPRQAHFVTVLSYQPGADGSSLNYRGALYGEGDANDPAQAFADIRRCIQLLQTEFDCPLEVIHTWHSGNRGPHWSIPPVVIGAKAGHPKLPRNNAAMVQRLFPSSIAPTLDRSVYSAGMGRMWRLPNRRRADTGRYKVPLSMREVLHKPYADLEAFTLRPRKGIFWPSDEELSPCQGLVQLYQETVTAIEREAHARPQQNREESARGGDVELLLNRCAFIRHCRDDAATLTEPEWYAAISNISRCEDGPASVHRISELYAGYSAQETDAKITHALKDTGPHTCAFIRALGFKGCPPGGCGVKAPIGLSRPSWHKSLAGGQSSSGYAPPPPMGGLYVPSASQTTHHTAREGRYV